MSELVERSIRHAYAVHRIELDEYQEQRVRDALIDAEVLLRHVVKDVRLHLGLSGRRAGKAVTAGVAQTAVEYMKTVISEEKKMSQPDPIPNDGPSIHDLLIADYERDAEALGIQEFGQIAAGLRERKRIGVETYGVALQPNNGRDMLQDAYEEVLDLLTYLRGAVEEDQVSESLALAFSAADDVAFYLQQVINKKGTK